MLNISCRLFCWLLVNLKRYRLFLAVAITLVIAVAAVSIHNGKSASSTGTLYITPNNVNASSGTITYSVYVDNVGASATSGINGWNLIIDDHDAAQGSLTPVSISIAGNLLSTFGTVQELINCVNGGTVGAPPGPGNQGCDVNDGPGIVHTAAVLQGPATPTSISGLIATISYTAVSASPAAITFVSATTPPGDQLTDGGPTPVPHADSGATYNQAAADFVISATDSPNFNPGGTGSSTVTLTSLNSFSGSVTLTSDVYPATGLSVSCPSSATPSASGATVTCNFSSSTGGSYVVTLTGTGGGQTHLAPIHVKVGDFRLGSPIPPSVSVAVGDTSKKSTVAVSGVNGFTGSVAMSSSVHAADTSTDPTGLGVNCTPTSVSVAATGSTTVTCAYTPTKPGKYSVVITGTYSFTGGTVTHTQGVSVTVTGGGNLADFTIAPTTATTVNTAVGVAGTQTITLAAVNGFTGTVNLAANTPLPAGLVCLALSPVTLPGTTTATLSCTAQAAADYGPVTVTGTSGTLTHATGAVTFHVVSPSVLSLSANPTTVNSNINVAGTSAITVSAPTGTTGAVTFQVTPSTGLTCDPLASITLPAVTATLSCKAAAAADYTAGIVATVGALTSQPLTVNYHVTSPGLTLSANPMTVNTAPNVAGTSAITVVATGGVTGSVSFTVTPQTGLTCPAVAAITLPATTATLSCTAAAVGDFTAQITGTASGVSSPPITVTFHVAMPGTQGFTVTAQPTSVTCGVGDVSKTSIISVAGTGGFSGTVNLAVQSSMPSVATGTLSASSVTGASGSTTLNITCVSAGTATLTVTGTSGSLTPATATVGVSVTTVTPQSFTITASPTSVSCNTGGTAKSTITLTGMNGFTNTVNLVATVSPSTGLSASLTKTTITGGSGNSDLSLTCTAAGTFIVTVTGTSGEITKSVMVTATVSAPVQGGFGISVSPSTLQVLQGCGARSNITVTSTGFTGEITLSTSVSGGADVQASLSKMHVSIGTGVKGNAVLTVSVEKDAAVGTYTVTVMAKNAAGLSHSLTVTVHVVKNSCVHSSEDNDACKSNEKNDNEAKARCNSNDSKEAGDHNVKGECGAGDNDEENSCGCPSLGGEDEDQAGDQGHHDDHRHVGQKGETGDKEHGHESGDRSGCGCVTDNDKNTATQHGQNNENNDQQKTGQQGGDKNNDSRSAATICTTSTVHQSPSIRASENWQ